MDAFWECYHDLQILNLERLFHFFRFWSFVKFIEDKSLQKWKGLRSVAKKKKNIKI